MSDPIRRLNDANQQAGEALKATLAEQQQAMRELQAAEIASLRAERRERLKAIGVEREGE